MLEEIGDTRDWCVVGWAKRGVKERFNLRTPGILSSLLLSPITCLVVDDYFGEWDFL